MAKVEKVEKIKREKVEGRPMKIGVVGYSGAKFNEKKAKSLVRKSFDLIEKYHSTYPDGNYIVVSGLTDMGIPALAYREALKREWGTMGVACSKANEYELFPVDHKVISGEEWGDESEVFLYNIDVLIRIGGGPQSMDETQKAKDMGLEVYEYDLAEEK